MTIYITSARRQIDVVRFTGNQLDQEAVDATSIVTFKSKLDGFRYDMGFFVDQSAES